MTERYVTLLGAEQVQAAGASIARAADDIRSGGSSVSEGARAITQAVYDFEVALRGHQEFMDAWLIRFAAAMRGNTPP